MEITEKQFNVLLSGLQECIDLCGGFLEDYDLESVLKDIDIEVKEDE